jgi:hypothetical protein
MPVGNYHLMTFDKVKEIKKRDMNKTWAGTYRDAPRGFFGKKERNGAENS